MFVRVQLAVNRGETGVTSFGMNRILCDSGGNGPITTLPDLTFDGTTLTCYGGFNTFGGLQWGSQFSRLNRVLSVDQYSSGLTIGDIVLISLKKQCVYDNRENRYEGINRF